LVEDRCSERGQPAVHRHPTLDTSICRHPALDASFHGDPALDPTFDRIASVDSALDGIETLNRQPSFEWIYTLDELAQPRLLRASARQYSLESIPKQ
jgi:hypothetical protein